MIEAKSTKKLAIETPFCHDNDIVTQNLFLAGMTVIPSFRSPAAAFFSIILTCFVVLGTRAQASEWANLGPIFHQFPLTLNSGTRTEALGPFLNFETTPEHKSWAIPPIFSHIDDTATDSTEWDFVYPIFTYDRFGPEYRFQILQLFSISGGNTQAGEHKKRITLFPIYFQQRSDNPTYNYTAFLPFYGHLHNRLLRDEVKFVMFPLFVESRKKDVVTDNYLFPFFHLRHGNGLNGWQVWPIVGHEHKELTTKTNGFDEIELVGGHDNRFVLWPFYFKSRQGLGTTNPVSLDALIPFYSFQRSPGRDSSTYFWPLGYTSTVDREKKYVEHDMPWPFVVFAHGEGKTARRIWPFFGEAKTQTLESDFYLWPFYKYNRAHAEPLDRERRRILFFLYSDLIERNTTAGTALHRKDVWPFFTSRHDHNGNYRLQILAPLEPFLPGNKSIERDYSPVWSFWRAEQNPKAQTASQSLFWNLYRKDRTAETKKISLLFGLIQYSSNGGSRSWRVLYIPFGASKTRDKQPAAVSADDRS